MKSILQETQKDRDIELSKLTGISLSEIEAMQMMESKGKFNVSHLTLDGADSNTKKEEFEGFYRKIKIEYLKILMYTSIKRRGKELIKLLNNTKGMTCLDYGTGTGTHAIALLEKGNRVDILDVEGESIDFAKRRIEGRGFNVRAFTDQSLLTPNYYDLVICTNVLEHVPYPLDSLKYIWKSMKKGGMLHLLVSTMINPSKGHFKSSIDEWKNKGIKFVKDRFTLKEKFLYVKK